MSNGIPSELTCRVTGVAVLAESSRNTQPSSCLGHVSGLMRARTEEALTEDPHLEAPPENMNNSSPFEMFSRGLMRQRDSQRLSLLNNFQCIHF